MNSSLKLLFTVALVLLPICSRGTTPNIVMIVVDDLGYADLSCTELAQDVQTPNIDKLAERGVRFTNAYATAPICNASRVSLITGCYQQRQGQYWYVGPGLHDPEFTTIAEALKQQGYATGYVGKFHHGSVINLTSAAIRSTMVSTSSTGFLGAPSITCITVSNMERLCSTKARCG